MRKSSEPSGDVWWPGSVSGPQLPAMAVAARAAAASPKVPRGCSSARNFPNIRRFSGVSAQAHRSASTPSPSAAACGSVLWYTQTSPAMMQ